MSLKNGKLTVDANNSDLGQILKDVADISGMTIDGLDKSARIFGAYGPGSPSVVLSHLLAGSGYNFVMIGSRNDGVPRQLLLTAQNNNAPALPAANRPATVAATPQTQASAPIPADTDPRVPSTDAEQTEPSEAAPAQTDSPPPPAEETPEEPDSLHQQMHQLELQNMQQMQQTQQTPPQ